MKSLRRERRNVSHPRNGERTAMRILRLAWSDYQSETSLRREASAVRERGWEYSRAGPSGTPPEDLTDHDVLLVNSTCPVGPSLLERWGSGGLLVTLTNGYDHVDLEACAAHDVSVARTPLARADRVAEHTLGSMFALCRAFPAASRRVLDGAWERTEAFGCVHRLAERRVGLVGYGVIGRRVADRIRELTGAPVLVNDPACREAIEARDGLRYRSRADLLAEADLVSLHADLNPSTEDYLNAKALDRLPEGAMVVNTARGEHVVVPALLERIRSGRLGGAALDVFRTEPPGPSLLEAMSDLDNLLLTPHAAGFGEGLLEDLRTELLETLRARDRDEPLPHPVPLERNRWFG